MGELLQPLVLDKFLPQAPGMLGGGGAGEGALPVFIHLTSSQLNVHSLQLVLQSACLLKEWDWNKEMAQRWPEWWVG